MSGMHLETDIEDIARRLHGSAEVLSGKTVLLCGGGGFLGRYFVALFDHLNRQVLQEPCRVTVMDNYIVGAPKAQAAPPLPNVTFLNHNVIHALPELGRVDYIVQAAGIASPYYYRRYPLETLEVATVGTKNVLEFAVRNRAKFLFFSSSEIYGDPDPRHVPTAESYRGNVSCLGPRACYDESKRLGETLTQIYSEVHGIATNVVRPFNVYGPGMQPTDYRVLPNFAARIVAGEPLEIYGSGNQTRTFCYISDAIVGFMKVLLEGKPGEVYNIGIDRPEVTILELAREIERVLGKKLHIRRMDYPSSYPADEPNRRCPDISKARNHVGYDPQIDLATGLKQFFTWAKRAYSNANVRAA